MYNMNYHIVWSVKYRRKVITPEVEDYMREVIQ
ncbi:transposase, partial [Erysipelotrichaceae bacterium RD49]|nr:transposase [Erysipelotrichaceae bacterium RD49]